MHAQRGFRGLRKILKPVYLVKFGMCAGDEYPVRNIATPNEVVVTTTFNIELGAAGGELLVCMPYAMVEPIRDILYSSLQGDHLEVDKRWVRLLTKQVQIAEVELVANLGHAPVTLEQVLNMHAGDVISLAIPEAIVAQVDGVPVLECRYGISSGQYALRVDKMLATAESNSTNGDDYA